MELLSLLASVHGKEPVSSFYSLKEGRLHAWDDADCRHLLQKRGGAVGSCCSRSQGSWRKALEGVVLVIGEHGAQSWQLSLEVLSASRGSRRCPVASVDGVAVAVGNTSSVPDWEKGQGVLLTMVLALVKSHTMSEGHPMLAEGSAVK